MNSASQRFLDLHQDHNVVKWQWVFGETMLRAFAESGATATISRAELDALVASGTMCRGVGFAVHLTSSQSPQEREVA